MRECRAVRVIFSHLLRGLSPWSRALFRRRFFRQDSVESWGQQVGQPGVHRACRLWGRSTARGVGARGLWSRASGRYLQRYFGVSSPSSRPLTSLPGKSPLLPSRRRSRRPRRSTSRCNICLGALLALCLTRPLVSTCVGSAVLAATSCSSLAITAAIVKNDASSRWGLPSRHGAPIASILTSCAPSAPVIRA